VTKLGGTVVKDGLTTVHETSVIGTYINGKYAQVLQSSSRILREPVIEEKIHPSSTNRILKTIGPHHGKLKPQLEPTPAYQQEESSLPLEDLFNAPSGEYFCDKNIVAAMFYNLNLSRTQNIIHFTKYISHKIVLYDKSFL